MSQALWDVLACPCADHAPLKIHGEEVVCTACGRHFPVRDGIPVMLIDESRVPEAPTKKTRSRSPKGE